MSDTAATGLNEVQLEAFERDGFLSIDRLLDDSDLEPVEREYDRLSRKISAALLRTGELSDSMDSLPFGLRYERLIAFRPELHHFFNISLPLTNDTVDPETYRMHAGSAVFNLMRHPKILDIVDSVIGPEIYASPVQQMRIKPPAHAIHGDLKGHSNVGATTWHQDIVALLPEADFTEQLTVWVALTEATEENGCLVSIPGSHKQGPMTHCSNLAIASEPQVPGRLVENREVVPLPIKKGGVVLFHKMNLHRALPNRSEQLRWSMDLRYHPTGQATGRPAFPGFVARSKVDPASELRDPAAWAHSWEEARETIVTGQYKDRVFEDKRWNDAAVC